MTGIILLNWNGWKDTIACLESLYKLKKCDYFIIIVDNGSDDDSVERITEWFRNNDSHRFQTLEEGGELNFTINSGDSLLYRLPVNYGFAKGNNRAIELAKKIFPDYLLLLNNDTEVEPDFLFELESFISSNPEYKALTPMIRYYGEKDKIWNCGGKLFFGLRKYNYADEYVSSVKEKGFMPISIITGCALFIPYELVENNTLLTERFFFGEEDFDFSIRMREKGYKMACVLTSQIYHKVSSSSAKMNNLSKIYIHYLDRFIDVGLHFSPFKFFVWRQLNYMYIFILLRFKLRFPAKDVKRLIKLLSSNYNKYTEVNREMFFSIVNKKIDEIA